MTAIVTNRKQIKRQDWLEWFQDTGYASVEDGITLITLRVNLKLHEDTIIGNENAISVEGNLIKYLLILIQIVWQIGF